MAETGWAGGGERGEFRGDQWREKRVWGDRWELGYRDVEERERTYTYTYSYFYFF